MSPLIPEAATHRGLTVPRLNNELRNSQAPVFGTLGAGGVMAMMLHFPEEQMAVIQQFSAREQS